jgi:hypothetical protein
MPSIIIRRCCICIGILAFSLLASAETKAPPPSYWGCWIVKKVMPTVGITGLSQKQANAVIGTRLVFTPACARSGSTVVQAPTYSVKVLSSREFFGISYIPLKQIGIEAQQVTEVDLLKAGVSDLDFYGTEVFIRQKDIVIDVEGTFFLAERVKGGDALCKCEVPSAK